MKMRIFFLVFFYMDTVAKKIHVKKTKKDAHLLLKMGIFIQINMLFYAKKSASDYFGHLVKQCVYWYLPMICTFPAGLTKAQLTVITTLWGGSRRCWLPLSRGRYCKDARMGWTRLLKRMCIL